MPFISGIITSVISSTSGCTGLAIILNSYPCSFTLSSKSAQPSKHVIAVTKFIDDADLNLEYVEKPYFVTPENEAQSEAFAVVREALASTGKVAIGKIALSGREHVLAVKPAGDRGMIGYTLRYHNELRNQADYFREIKDVKVDEESLDLAKSLIAKKAAKLDISKFEDGYEVAIKELVDAKLKNLPIPKDEAPRVQSGKVINLLSSSKTTRFSPSQTALIWRQRNPGDHRKWWALLAVVFENQDTFADVQDLNNALKIATGLFDSGKTIDGIPWVSPKSISYAAMDQASFETFCDKGVDIILSRIVPNVSRGDLEARVHEILDGHSPRS